MPRVRYDTSFRPKTFNPTNKTYSRIGSRRRFGVELEYDWLSNDFNDASDKTVFGCKEDCSVNGGEFYSPILFADQGLTEVKKLCEFATEQGFRVAEGAGYHLHIDMTNEPVDKLKQIALAYHYTKDFWLNVVPSYRRSFSYSRPHQYNRGHILPIRELGDFQRFCSRDRYEWVNWNAYRAHTTVEIRCHETSISTPTVKNWIIAHTRFCDAMADTSVGRITRIFSRKKFSQLVREMRVIFQSPTVSNHFVQRYREFQAA